MSEHCIRPGELCYAGPMARIEYIDDNRTMTPHVSKPRLEIRETPQKGRGLFAGQRIRRGHLIIEMHGNRYSSADLPPELFATQIGPDLWLASDGSSLDDLINHSCEPNAGFVTGEAILFALRDIEPGEEITWDYSTSIDEPGWRLKCLCRSSRCRQVVLPWRELSAEERNRLRPIALHYLRQARSKSR